MNSTAQLTSAVPDRAIATPILGGAEQPLLIIPVENQVRELDAKLLLAACAAERGFRVVIGSRYYLHHVLTKLPRGVVLAKSMRSVSRMTLELTRRFGHDIVAWDEEGLVRYAGREYYGWRYSKPAFRTVSRLLSWGQDDANLFAGYDGFHGVPIHATGNPRIDLLRPELRECFSEEADRLRGRFGEFILVNTNFSFVNAFVPSLNLLRPSMAGVRKPGRAGAGLSPEAAGRLADHQKAICDAFRALLPELSSYFSERTIVLRPHPSENHDFWRDAAAGLGNVRVLHEGNVVPWLMASGALLHNGCTTAVEAAVLGKPAVTYRPVRSDAYDYPLPNALSREALDPGAVCDMLSAALAGRSHRGVEAARDKLLPRHLSALDGTLASDRVVDVLVHAGYRDRPPRKPGLGNHTVGRVGLQLRTALQRVSMRLPGSRHGKAHQVHRFPPLTVDDVERRVRVFGKALGRFEALSASELSPDLFLVTRTPPRADRLEKSDASEPRRRPVVTGAAR